MKHHSVRLPIPPPVLLTLLLTTLLLLAGYLIAPQTMRLALLACAGLMVMLVAFTSVELTLYLLILSTLLSPELELGGAPAPSEGVRSSTLGRGVTLRLDDLLLSVICLTWLFRMAASQGLGFIRKTPVNQPIVWYWMATVLATVAGFYAGRVGPSGFFFVLKYLEFFLIFYMIINQIHDEDAIHRYLMVMMFTCFVVALLGLAQIPGGERVSAPFEGEEGEPNSFGGYLVLMFGVALGLFLNEVDKMKRWRWGILLGMIVVPLAFTQSRSSYLAIVVTIGLFIVLSKHHRFLVGCALAGLVLAPVVVPQQVVDRIMFTFGQAQESGQITVGGAHIDTSTSDRLLQWERVLTKDFPKEPLLGYGVTGGRFMDAQYPRVLNESGLIGLVLFFWLLRRMWVLFSLCHKGLDNPEFRGMALGAQCAFGGLLVHAIGSNSFMIVRIMEPMMILLGLILAALLVQQEKEERARLDVSMQAAQP